MGWVRFVISRGGGGGGAGGFVLHRLELGVAERGNWWCLLACEDGGVDWRVLVAPGRAVSRGGWGVLRGAGRSGLRRAEIRSRAGAGNRWGDAQRALP